MQTVLTSCKCVGSAYLTGKRHTLHHPLPHVRRNVAVKAATSTSSNKGSAVEPKAEVSTSRGRKFNSLLPPFFERATLVEEVQKGLWTFTQPLPIPFSAASAELRMTVAQLADGSLWLHGPIAPTEEVLEALAEIGTVKHIVIPNTSPEHWYFGPALAKAFPEAKVWGTPGTFKDNLLPVFDFGFRALQAESQCATVGDAALEEWGNEVDAVLLSTPFLTEYAFVLRRYKTLLVSDTALMVDERYAVGEKGEKQARGMGIWKRLGPIQKPLMAQYQKESKEWVEKVLKLDFETVIPAHTASPVSDGKKAFEECFDFLLVPGS